MQVVKDNKKCHYEISLNKHVTRDLPIDMHVYMDRPEILNWYYVFDAMFNLDSFYYAWLPH